MEGQSLLESHLFSSDEDIKVKSSGVPLPNTEVKIGEDGTFT